MNYLIRFFLGKKQINENPQKCFALESFNLLFFYEFFSNFNFLIYFPINAQN